MITDFGTARQFRFKCQKSNISTLQACKMFAMGTI